jgi:hypothetical protein
MKILEPMIKRFLSSPELIITTCGRLAEISTTKKSNRLLRPIDDEMLEWAAKLINHRGYAECTSNTKLQFWSSRYINEYGMKDGILGG